VFIFTNSVPQKILVSGTVNYFKCSHNITVNVQWGSQRLLDYECLIKTNFINTR
jgi:hypothetical protein